MPTVRSSTLGGFFTGAPAGSFIPRNQRWITFHATIDMGNLPTLGDRMADTFRYYLIIRLREAAEIIIERAKAKLVPGHGYDTGLMHDTLVAKLVGALEASMPSGDGVYYDLESDEAWYWVFVEFGHMLRDGNWWPGYFFLTSTVIESESLIRQRVREAWGDTVVALAAQARVGGTALPGPL